MADQSLTHQSHCLKTLVKGMKKDRFASGLLVTVQELDGSTIFHKAVIDGEFGDQLFSRLGELLVKSLNRSIKFREQELKEAKEAVDISVKEIDSLILKSKKEAVSGD